MVMLFSFSKCHSIVVCLFVNFLPIYMLSVVDRNWVGKIKINLP